VKVEVAAGVGPLWCPEHYPLRVSGNLHKKVVFSASTALLLGLLVLGWARLKRNGGRHCKECPQAREQGHGTPEASCHPCLVCPLGQPLAPLRISHSQALPGPAQCSFTFPFRRKRLRKLPPMATKGPVLSIEERPAFVRASPVHRSLQTTKDVATRLASLPPPEH
ncbi:hypothetical protein A6R68_22781, partial [Neotoma lepida]